MDIQLPEASGATDQENQKHLALQACDCAEQVLQLFEEERPDDDRPRKAIEAGRAWARGETKVSEVRAAAFAAHAAARDCTGDTARDAARAAGHAAATAHVSGHAQHTTTYAERARNASYKCPVKMTNK